MDNLMALLGDSDKKSPSKMKADTAPDAALAEDSDAMGAEEGDDGFEQAATEAFEALQSGDADAFGEALKHCIEMVQ